MIKDFMEGLIAMGNEEFDSESYRRSQSYQGILENQECMIRNEEEESRDALAYWEAKGLKKELHGAEEWETKWASYLPMRYYRGEDPDRRYPLLFVLHGHNNPIYLAESYGYTHIAAREEVIVIIPEKETADQIDRLYEYAKKHYPVDLSRVYMVGYSLGGFMAGRHALRVPERYAGVGIGGMIFANGESGDHIEHGVLFPGETITEEMIKHAAEVKIPVCNCMGENEFVDILPLWREPRIREAEENLHSNAMDMSATNKIASVNNWRRTAGCQVVPMETLNELVKYSADIVTEKLGFPFERTQVRTLEGRSHYIGDCVDGRGETYARFICVGKSPHWPSRALAELTWEFISRFARDTVTGRIFTR